MEHRLNEILNEVTKDLQDGINKAMLHLQQGMKEYLSNTIDMEELLKMVQGMGIPNIMGLTGTPMPGFDAYKILGLDKSATDEEVKQRYRLLLHKIHPDVAGVKGTEFLTQMLVLAYNIISKERWE